jgi:hypothetical protein
VRWGTFLWWGLVSENEKEKNLHERFAKIILANK